MKKVRFIIFLVFSSLFLNVFSQEEKLPDYFNNDKDNQEVRFVENKTINSDYNLEQYQSRSTSQISLVSLKQIGDENTAEINYNTTGKQRIYQIGDNNAYGFSNYFNNSNFNIDVLQGGNNNSLEVLGTNSIINNMKVIQFNGSTLSVISY